MKRPSCPFIPLRQTTLLPKDQKELSKNQIKKLKKVSYWSKSIENEAKFSLIYIYLVGDTTN